MLWAEHEKRWYIIQQNILKEPEKTLISGSQLVVEKENSLSAAQTGEEKEFQLVEAENADLRRKIAEILATNRQLGKQLDELDTNSSSLEQLKTGSDPV